MIRTFLAFFALLSVAWAQPAPTADDGHNHAPGDGHNHSEVPKPSASPREANLDFFWRKSDEAFHAGNYPLALEWHRNIQYLDPQDVESYGIAAWLSWSLGRPETAHQFLKSGLQNNPRDPEMWDTNGQQQDLEKNYAQSFKSYKKAVALAGKNAPELLRRRLAHAGEKAGQRALALKTWRALVRDFPDSPVNANNLKRLEAAK